MVDVAKDETKFITADLKVSIIANTVNKHILTTITNILFLGPWCCKRYESRSEVSIALNTVHEHILPLPMPAAAAASRG